MYTSLMASSWSLCLSALHLDLLPDANSANQWLSLTIIRQYLAGPQRQHPHKNNVFPDPLHCPLWCFLSQFLLDHLHFSRTFSLWLSYNHPLSPSIIDPDWPGSFHDFGNSITVINSLFHSDYSGSLSWMNQTYRKWGHGHSLNLL